jgi:glycerol-3-phosphate acyltransferase PlsY
VTVALLLVAAYLLGSFPTAGLVGRRGGTDPSTEGSGNPGATNVYRLMGRRAAALVLLGDVAKGVVSATVGNGAGGRAGLFAAGAAAVVGHCFPAGRVTRGGKGVATAAGLAAVAFPVIAATAAVVWAGLVAATRKASLASLVTIAYVPIAAAIAGRPAAELAVSAAIAALVVARHAGNLRRLLRGEERSLR